MKNFRLLLLIIPLLFLCGCSIGTDIYIQNLTTEDKSIVVKYKLPIKDLPSYKRVEIPYVNALKTPKEFNKINDPNFLKFEQVDEYSITMKIPKESTVRIETTSNTRYYEYLDSFELNQKTISLQDILENSKRKGAHYIYHIK